MPTSEISRAAGSIEGLSDAYLVAVHVAGATEVLTFMAEAHARIAAKERTQRQLTSWEAQNRERALSTPLDETQPAVCLSALVVSTKADFNSSVVTAYAELVFPGKGITSALIDGDPYRVGRFARSHNGSYAPWSFIDSRGDEAVELLAYAREVL
ncbi:hypothetical protein [Gordonia sp. 852002-10350_SCH5691597]|uniref:hypothetical protein n=1 Tax=Gordonia sp. 852002-10350_SCH5691597 TaxID=1834085 RepID=UPI0007EADB9E|nr:hypothetical protein [Gordonia sp. 852002-10350_SCH5691597]OBA67745.1 hypothetical protein A5777_16670 [Gordonia sp. 852002-10350_SCH5691597]